jgi:hypothetical protein
MKRRMLALLAAVVAVALLHPAAAQAEDGRAEAKYQAVLAAAKADPAATDWQALRFAYADRPSFSLFAADMGRKAINAALAADDWQGVLAAADKLLDVDYVDGEAHMASAIAHEHLGKPDDAKRERAIAVAIFKSIMLNGDGRSREHAFVVISVAEEYELMRARQRRVVHQSLVKAADHSYDVLEATGRDGDNVTFYFQIDRVMAAETRMLGQRKRSP